MRKVKIAIAILILLVAGTVSYHLWMNLQNRQGTKEEEGRAGDPPLEADMRLERIRFVEEKRGQRTWELDAKAIQQFQDQNIILLEDVKVTFYTKDGRSFVLSGNRGKVYQDSKNMELVGDVLLTSSDGYRLKTHSISYEHDGKKVRTPDPVEIEGREIQLSGRGMWVDMEGRTMKILSQAKTRWRGGGGG